MSTTQQSRVVVHSKLTVVSSRPVKAGTAHAFTALDHAMGLHTLHVVFYYNHKLFGCFDLDPLRLSLSETLSLHPPVTGRIAQKPDGNWEVKCTDAGVRVFMARVATTLDDWLRSADGSEERLLTVWDDMPDDPSTWSPYRIQVKGRKKTGFYYIQHQKNFSSSWRCLVQLEGTETSMNLDVLCLFSQGTWSDYKSDASHLLQLVPDQVLKRKQLTVLTLAETNKVQFAAGRDPRPGQLGSMIHTLSNCIKLEGRTHTPKWNWMRCEKNWQLMS